jgi:ABC-type glycerol-3-phosphate transport system substrate-binding protein
MDGGALDRVPPPDAAWTRPRTRREVLRSGAAVALGGGLASLLAACAAPGAPTAPPVASGAATSGVTGRITVLVGGGNPLASPPLRSVYDGFRAEHPGIEWDVRALPGGGPEYDRLARAAIASGEPVGLVLIDGQQVRGWVRDGLLADLDADPALTEILARVPEQFHLAGPTDSGTRAFPLAATRGVHTTGLFYNRAILERAGLRPPRTIADLEAMVEPLAAFGVAPLVHPAGDAFFNQMLITWILPMIVEQSGGDALAFAERTVRGEIRYDSPEWLATYEAIAALSTSGVLIAGSGAIDYATMQQLFLRGKVATTYNGTWLLPELLGGTATGEFDLHVAPPPLVDGATRPRPILAWGGFALPAGTPHSRDAVLAFLEYASRSDVDRAVVEGLQTFSPMAASNAAIENEIAQEFLPMFDDAITPLDWLWEPEITAELDGQVQALIKGDADPGSVGAAAQAVAERLRSTGRGYDS